MSMGRKTKELNALKSKANFLLAQGKVEEAKIYYLKGLEIEPNDIDMRIQLASIYFSEENWLACESILVKADELKPKDDVILQNLGAVYIQMEKWENAFHHLNEAVLINSHNACAWNNMGLIQKERQMLEEAAKCFNKAIENDPDDLEYVFNLGENYESKREYGEAKKIFTALLVNAGQNQELLESKITNLTELINTERMTQLKKTLQVSTKLHLNRLQDGLQMSNQEFNRKIVDWAHEFGFTIEGEFLIVNQSTVSEFLDSLDNQFSDWSKTSKSKESKI